MKVPNPNDISPTCGLNLDERVALQHFSGVGKQNAEVLFAQNPLLYASDLFWMGDVAFDYYFPCFIAYLKSEKSGYDADALHALVRILEFKLFDEGKTMPLSTQAITDAVRYCLTNYQKFKVDAVNYGRLNDNLKMILKKISPSANH